MNTLLSILKKIPILKLLIPLYVCLVALFVLLISRGNMQLLQPAGYIAGIQSRILWGAIICAAIIGSLIVGMFFLVAFRNREGTSRHYQPEWTASKKVQLLGWGIPLIGVLALSFLIWDTAHLVDPYRPISSAVQPVTIQVIALRWKWLFIYPNDHIATVNALEIPAGTPVAFQLTADAPMNSFWIPRLGGQVYAMPGMVTQLHLEADTTGTYTGGPAEMSGGGFAGMGFSVKAVSAHDYAMWKAATKTTVQSLNANTYAQLAEPSSYTPPTAYVVPDTNLFENTVMQFMGTGNYTMQSGGMSM